MMCLLKMEDGKITGWIIGADSHDIRRSLPFDHADATALAEWLYRNEFVPLGKHELPNGHLLLVS